MVDIKNTPMAREILIASQTATEAPVNGLLKVDLKLDNPSRRGRFNSPLRYALLTFTAGAMALSIACGSERPAQAGTSPSAPEVTAEAFQAQNPEAFQTNIPNVGRVGIQIPEPIAPPTPEANKIEPFDCGILSPENCAKGEYVQWKRPDGQSLKGFGFKLNAGEPVKIREDLVVAGSKFNQPHTYNGFYLNALKRDGTKKYTYFIADAIFNNITNTGKGLPAGTVIATIGGSDARVFKEADYNFILYFSSEEERETIANQLRKNLRVINNEPLVKSSDSSMLIFWDVQPTQSSP